MSCISFLQLRTIMRNFPGQPSLKTKMAFTDHGKGHKIKTFTLSVKVSLTIEVANKAGGLSS